MQQKKPQRPYLLISFHIGCRLDTCIGPQSANLKTLLIIRIQHANIPRNRLSFQPSFCKFFNPEDGDSIIILKGSNYAELHSALLFLWLHTSFSILKTKARCFGSWLCSRLQVKLPLLLGPIKWALPNPKGIGIFTWRWEPSQVPKRSGNTECRQYVSMKRWYLQVHTVLKPRRPTPTSSHRR
jgi:hypothetical protein